MASNLSSLIEISLSRLRIFSYSTSESLSEDLKSFKIVYAKTPQTKLELQTIINSTEFLNKWLKEKDVDFKIISDRNPAHESIERIEL